jgi:hypothetical protein
MWTSAVHKLESKLPFPDNIEEWVTRITSSDTNARSTGLLTYK